MRTFSFFSLFSLFFLLGLLFSVTCLENSGACFAAENSEWISVSEVSGVFVNDHIVEGIKVFGPNYETFITTSNKIIYIIYPNVEFVYDVETSLIIEINVKQ